MKTLAVVIVSWNTRAMLRDCLERVMRATTTPCELWVVDNGSSDGSPEMVACDFPEVRLLLNPDNRGFAAANNQVLAQLGTPYVVLLNSDTLVHDHALDRMVAYMEAHPEVGALGPRLENRDGSLQPSAFNFYSTLGSLVENRLVARWWRRRTATTRFLSYWDHASTRAVDWVTGACLMVRGELLATVGLLDERFFMYGEEIDWQYRMHRAGHAVHYLPEAVVTHFGGGSAARVAERMRRQELLSRRLLIDKHYPFLTRWGYRLKRVLAQGYWRLVEKLRSPA